MSEHRPSKYTSDQEDSDSKISSTKKVTRFRKDGETKNLATQYKEADRQNREKFKEFQERYAVLKGKLPKVGKHSEEVTQEMTTLSQPAISVEEVKEMQAISTAILSVTDEAGSVAKILRERDECSQKTKAALEVLEEKKHQFIEYQNLVARVQKDFEKSDSTKLEIHKESVEQAHQQVDLEKEALLKDIEDKSKVIRALQLKVDRLSQTNEDLKISLNSAVISTDVIDNSCFVSELELKNKQIKSLEETVDALLNDKLAYEDKISQKEKEVDSLHIIIHSCIDKVSNINVILQISRDDEIIGVDQLESKICAIETEICKIQQSNKEIDIKLKQERESGSSSPSVKGSKRSKSHQRGRNSKSKSPWASVPAPKQDPPTKDTKCSKTEDSVSIEKISDLQESILNLNEKLIEYQFIIDKRDEEINVINKTLSERENEMLELTKKYEELLTELQSNPIVSDKLNPVSTELVPKLVPKDISTNENIEFESIVESIESSTNEAPEKMSVDILELKIQEAREQVDVLSKQLDDANKNMIKTKAAHKIKIKQMQKTIDGFSKMSDAGSEVVRLNNEVAVLIQKVAELEEDKGNLQLHLVDYDSVKVSDHESGQSLKDLQNVAEARLQAISELELQKFDLVQELHAANQKTSKLEEKVDELLQLENDHVSFQMNSVQLEEQLEKFNIECKSLRDQSYDLKVQNESLNDLIKILNQEKSNLSCKLESYIQENLDLSEKLEKLTAEKVSSAESIEIVESLTTQEKLEIERFNEGITQEGTVLPTQNNDYFSPELNEDILKLSQDSVELHNKIELFTQERREVMEKMDILRNDNLALNKNIEELIDIKQKLETELETLKSETISLKDTIAILDAENKDIKSETEIALRKKTKLEEKLTDLTAKESIDRPSTVEMSVVEQHIPLVEFGTQVELINSETYDANTKSVKKLTKEILKLKNMLKEKNIEHDSYSQMETQVQSLSEELFKIKEENISIKEEKNSLNLHIASLTEINTEHTKTYEDFQKVNGQLEDQLKIKDTYINELRISIGNLENQVTNLNIALNTEKSIITNKIEEINELHHEVVNLKLNIELKEQYVDSLQNDIHRMDESIKTFVERLKRSEEELLSLHRELDENENEMNNLIKERDFNLREINRLQNECQVKDDALTEISLKYSSQLNEIEYLRNALPEINEIKSTYETESKKLKDYNLNVTQKYDDIFEKYTNLEAKNNDLELKNKEFIEKLKKFAFNLKKKHNMCTELDAKVQDLTVQLEAQKDGNISALKIESNKILEEENTNLLSENVLLKLKLDGSSSQIAELSVANETLKAQLNNEHFTIERLTNENELLTSLQRDFQLSSNLSEKVEGLENNIVAKKLEIEKLLDGISQVQAAYDSFKFGHEAKLQERDLFIESLETDISKYKDRIAKLEDSISIMEEKRFSLERNASQLGYQVQELLENQKSVAEHAQHEDELERRMEALIAHDEVVEKKLEDSRVEIDELQGKIRDLLDVSQKQTDELNHYQNLVDKQKEEINKVNAFEEDKQSLQMELEKIHIELKKNTQKFEKIIKDQKEDFENLESELQGEISNLRMEKKNVFEEYEKSLEMISSLKIQLEEIHHHNSWLKSEYDIILSNYTEAKSFKECSDQFERKYREVSNEVVKLEALLEEKNKQLNTYKSFDKITTLTPETTNSSVQYFDDKKVTLSDYFSAPSEPSFDILNQIVSNKDIEQARENVPNIDICSQSQICQDLPSKLDNEPLSLFSDKIEVKENVIIPKTAYTCSPKDSKSEYAIESKELDDFETNWGEDAHLEEEHYQIQSLAIQSSDDYKKLNQQVDVLKSENEVLTNELLDIKNKLSKALKKIKDLKSSNDILEVKIQNWKKNRSSELDLAIQDELSTQVQKLEETASALQIQLDKSLGEKDALNKQVDVLTMANEKLIEIKEKLDCEMVIWKQKHKELSNRLSQFESFADIRTFSNADNIPPSTRMHEKKPEIEELRALIKELSADNEELQAMLEEMRQGKYELEKQVARQSVSYVSESDDIKVLKSEKEQHYNDMKLLQNKLFDSDSQIKKFESIFSDLKNQYDDSEAKRTTAETLVRETAAKAESMNCLNAELSNKLDVVCSENRHLLEGLQKIENENRSLFEKLSVLQKDYENLMQEKENVEYSFKHENTNEVSTLLQEKEIVTSELRNLKDQYQSLLNNFNKIQNDYSLLIQSTGDSERINQTEKENLLKQFDDASKELNEVKHYKDEYDKLNEKYLLLENNEVILIQKYNDAMENNDKVNKYNSSLQEDCNKLEHELKDSAIKIQKLHECIKNLEDHQIVAEVESKSHNIEEGNIQEIKQIEFSQRLDEYEILLHDKENRLKLALISIDDLNTNLYSKEREIEELRRQFSLLEKHLAESMYEKEAEIAKMRLEAYDVKTYYDTEMEKLQKEKDNVEKSVESKLSEMRTALENQELEIVTLKDALSVYESRSFELIAENKETKEAVDVQRILTNRDNDPNKAELDFAFYLLHQRSVKCDELTLELSSLLEERDTLQLRLSDALRLNESLRRRCSPAIDTQPENTGESLTVASVPEITEVDSSPSEGLRNKLTELKSVKHQRDIRLREEQEQRERELQLMQVDIANLPEEAATKLREAHYTLSRNTQSTSEVFLNWLMGKSTPKVVQNM